MKYIENEYQIKKQKEKKTNSFLNYKKKKSKPRDEIKKCELWAEA